MYYSEEETKKILIYHIRQIAANWTLDDFIMGHFTSGKEILIDFRDHKLANFQYRGEGCCRATVDELKELISFENEIPVIVLEAMNNALSGRKQITSRVVFSRFTEEQKLYVKLEIAPEEAGRRFTKWQSEYTKSRRGMGF